MDENFDDAFEEDEDMDLFEERLWDSNEDVISDSSSEEVVCESTEDEGDDSTDAILA